jgi:hypothetical protein
VAVAGLVKTGGGCASSFHRNLCWCSRMGAISMGIKPNWAAAESGCMWVLGGSCGSQWLL